MKVTAFWNIDRTVKSTWLKLLHFLGGILEISGNLGIEIFLNWENSQIPQFYCFYYIIWIMKFTTDHFSIDKAKFYDPHDIQNKKLCLMQSSQFQIFQLKAKGKNYFISL